MAEHMSSGQLQTLMFGAVAVFAVVAFLLPGSKPKTFVGTVQSCETIRTTGKGGSVSYDCSVRLDDGQSVTAHAIDRPGNSRVTVVEIDLLKHAKTYRITGNP
jgi:hypothetical protein